uniref:NADH dehydrogenase subunit 4L n=1 Tax=Ornithodoros noorsveldensis TaxID=1580573 RepID=UPI00073942A0|nr:NADH dehydrogenase subunit 4L [Ornithodoros noorsveldensis]AIZ58707.1 NADH dehydrogenase subunit 4L [Ornithodoros noorsveldensis]AIZ58720.1 NADH dehydrogenase subunit 4L [Ornithodoros noorsveldensis]UYB78492.1 NADH dehydrogenase subunit 4L [Ornithodoros noorsveldensis]
MLMVGMFFLMSGSLSMMVNRSHVLMLMLSLEFMYLGVMVGIIVTCGVSEFYLMMLIFMIVVVCEAGLGLSILVLSVYFYGNDKLQILNLLGC